MFSTFDVLVESSLHETAAKEFITVGWGKKETQFHGSVGKDGRRKATIDLPNVEELDKSISCCWRGDGEYFAVNHVGANGRMFKVYNKEGSLQYTSEVCEKLEVPIAWKPSGLWIAKPEILPNKYSITLFERNGLKHNELVLPFSADDERVVNLSWSHDSDIFLIETIRNGHLHCLYFYTICNYHWYLKHSIEFNGKVVYTWSQNYAEQKQLHLMTSAGEFHTLKFDFVVNHSNGKSDSDESIIAVIDGNKLLLTNFKSQLVPPPMASLEKVVNNPVNAVTFLQQPDENFDTNCFLTMDHTNSFKMYRCIFEKSVNGQRLIDVENVKEFTVNSPDSYTHLLWINTNHILLSQSSSLFLYSIDSGSIVHEISIENVVGSLERSGENMIVAQLVVGALLEFEIKDGEIKISATHLEKLPEFCEKIIATKSNGESAIYALKHNKKKLYLNSRELATEVTSFTITSDNDYMIYTTIGELKFMRIDKDVKQVLESRRIERGSRIVSLVKDKSLIVFQLPRGNLETISPRILSFKIIKRHLQYQKYSLAFDLLRKERINLNLLIDLNPQKFLKELQIFVKQIDNVQWLNLFLTDLKNEDVTKTMYKFCEADLNGQEVHDETFLMDEKITYLCDKMLNIFQELDARKYLLPSITCHVKNQQLETALQMIWDLKKSGSGDKVADDSLKYLLYLIDINVLYNIALGMYDYQLVLFVAQKSQKDPKEYVPFLNELNKLNPSYAKYKIDCYLKRFPKAIKHIAELCNDESKFEECIELVKKHQLYEPAMEAFTGNDQCYRRICVLFGDHLRVKGKLSDASLLYERGGEYQQALAGARNIVDWQRCIVLAKKCEFSDAEMKDLSSKLSNALKDSGRYKEASELIKRFQPGETFALVDILVQGRLYSEAILEVTLAGNYELIEYVVEPQLKIHLADTIKSIDNDRKLYIEQKERLLLLRQEKIRKIENPPDDDDEFSDTTSMMSSSMNSQSSRNSAKTFRSSKTKRKHERKLMNMKEGNKYEDVALLDSIWKLVHKIISPENQNAIKELLKNAVELGIDEYAKVLQVSKLI